MLRRHQDARIIGWGETLRLMLIVYRGEHGTPEDEKRIEATREVLQRISRERAKEAI